MKKLTAMVTAGVLALALVGCGSGDAEPNANEGSDAPAIEQQESQAAQVDFDGSAFSDTGDGVMYLSTAGGTSEGGNVPQVVAPADAVLMQIGVNTEGMDGSVCTLYVDGMENMKMNASEMGQNTISLEGDALTAGVHTVELVCMDGDAPTIYKAAKYEVVN